MSFKDYYYKLEDFYYKIIEKIDRFIPIQGIIDAIDKVMPSMIVFAILFILIVVLLIWYFLPSNVNITFVFNYDGTRIVKDLPFSVFVDDKNYNFIAKNGTANVSLPKADIYTVDVNTDDYEIHSDFSYSDKIVVELNKKEKFIPVQIEVKSNKEYVDNVSLSYSCSNVSYDGEEFAENGSVIVNVPEDCGSLQINANADSYKEASISCDSTSCLLNMSLITEVNGGDASLNVNTGTLLVHTEDSNGNPVDVKIDIYDASDQSILVDSGYSSNGTFTSLLAFGTYNVVISDDSYVAKSKIVELSSESQDVYFELEESQGNITLQLDENIGFTLNIKKEDGFLVFSGSGVNGIAEIPSLEEGKYYFDISPLDDNFAPLSNLAVDINSNVSEINIDIKEASKFRSMRINARVVDSTGAPVENAKLFLKDLITGFELLSYDIPETDANGETSFVVEEVGVYSLVAIKAFASGESEQFEVVEQKLAEMPDMNIEFAIFLGNASFSLDVLDEKSGIKLSNSVIEFFKKGNDESIGARVLGKNAHLDFSMKAGSYIYYKAYKDGYLPFYSHARLLETDLHWDENIYLKSEISEDISRANYIGAFSGFDKGAVSFTRGNDVYLYFDLINFNDDSKPMEFTFSSRSEGSVNVEQDPWYISEVYSSADITTKYANESASTSGNAQKVVLHWNNAEKAVYRVIIKMHIRNDSKNKDLEALNMNWKMKYNDVDIDSQQKTYLINSIESCKNDICTSFSLYDISNDLYVENIGNSINEAKYVLQSGKKYSLVFNTYNALEGPLANIYNAIFRINASKNHESFELVSSNEDAYNLFEFYEYDINGPESKSATGNGSQAVLLDAFSIENFFPSRYLSGNFSFKAIASHAFIDFWIKDNDHKKYVKNAPVSFIEVSTVSSKELSISLNPSNVLVPEEAQDLEVYVYDDTGSAVKDAFVSVKIKTPYDASYHILNNCKDLKTDPEGKAICNLPPLDKGTYVQIIAAKEGYKTYNRDDFNADIKVADSFVDFNPETLEAEMSYPKDLEVKKDLCIKNFSSKNLNIENISFELDPYSLNKAKSLVNIDAVNSYYENFDYGNKIVYAKEKDKDAVETCFSDFLRIGFLQNPDFSDPLSDLSGKLKITFKSDIFSFQEELPFSIVVKLNNMPIDSSCVSITREDAGGEDVYLDNGAVRTININLFMSCFLSSSFEDPAYFKKLFFIIKPLQGSSSIASFAYNYNGNTGTLLPMRPELIKENIPAVNNYGDTISLQMSPTEIKGSGKFSFKVMGIVDTINGEQSIESQEIIFNIHNMNLNNCIKVLDDNSNEVDFLTMEDFNADQFLQLEDVPESINGPGKEVVLKNICDNSKLWIRLCRDNQGHSSESCADSISENSLIVDNKYSKLDGFELDKEESIKIKRPSIPGAYIIDMWIRPDTKTSFRKFRELKVNVKTTSNYSLFSKNPFVPISECKASNKGSEKCFSDTIYLFNKDLFIDKYNDLDILSSIEECKDDKGANKDQPICYVNIEDLARSYSTGSISSDQGKVLFGVGLGGTLAGGGGLTAAILLGAASGPWGWVLAASLVGFAGLTTMITSFFAGDFSNKESYYELTNVSLKDSSVLYFNKYGLANSKFLGPFTEINGKYALLGGSSYIKAYKINKYVDGSGSISGSSYGSDLDFKFDCGSGYLPYKVIVDLKSIDQCSWEDPQYEIDGSVINFKNMKCHAKWLGDFKLNADIYVSCKMDKKTWINKQLAGLDYGIPNTGFIMLKYAGEKIEPGYKFFTLDMLLESPLDDSSKKLKYRVALYNPDTLKNENNANGEACTNAYGEVVGFTGKDALPNIKYNWSWKENGPYKDFNFCSNGNAFCDATQFTMNSFQHIIRFQNHLDILDKSLFNKKKIPIPEKVVLKNYSIQGSENFIESIDLLNENKDVKLKIKLVRPEENTELNYNFDLNILYSLNGIEHKEKLNASDDPAVYIINLNDLLGKSNLSDYNNENFSFTIVNLSSNPPQISEINLEFEYKEASYFELPVPYSTEYIDGKFALSYYTDEVSSFEKYLYYNVYLMEDAFTDDFLNDFVESCNSSFFECPQEVNILKDKIKEGKFRIFNLDSSNKVSPGLYGVRTIIEYKDKYMRLEDANINIVLQKLESPKINSILYYLPFDATLGLSPVSLDRQGYGVDFSGSSVNLFNEGLIKNIVNINSNSNPIAHIYISSNYDFSNANLFKRGEILNMKKNGNNITLNYLDLVQNKFSFIMSNKGNGPVKLCYYLAKNGSFIKGKEAVLPIFSENEDGFSFNGAPLSEEFPKIADIVCEDNPGIMYRKEELKNPSLKLNLFTNIYTLKNDDIKLYLNGEEIEASEKNDFTGSLLGLFEQIENKNLCISHNKDSLSIFYNE